MVGGIYTSIKFRRKSSFVHLYHTKVSKSSIDAWLEEDNITSTAGTDNSYRHWFVKSRSVFIE